MKNPRDLYFPVNSGRPNGRHFLVLPHPPIQTPILNRLSEMLLADMIATVKIGDRPRHIEDARVAAGGEAEALGDEFEEAVAGFVRFTEFANEGMERGPEQLADWLSGRNNPFRRNRESIERFLVQQETPLKPM